MDVKGCIGREEVLCGGPVELNMGIGTVGSALNAWRGKDSCDRQWRKSRRRLSQQTGSELPRWGLAAMFVTDQGFDSLTLHQITNCRARIGDPTRLRFDA